MIHGIDVSNHQQTVDWGAVARSGVGFGIVKATEAADYRDAWFARNWREMATHGLVRGAYHFARPSINGPEVEADFFLRAVGDGLRPGDLLALDMEDEKVAVGVPLAQWSVRWLLRVEAVAGFKPLFYTYPSYIPEHKLADPRLAEYGLWLASYQQAVPPPPRPWQRIAIWQYDHRGRIPGVAGPCDVNWFNGDDLAALRAYGKPGDEPADPDAIADAALEAAWRSMQWLGAKRFAALHERAYPDLPGGSDFAGRVLVCEGGVIGYHAGRVVDLTPRARDDWEQAERASGRLRPL